MLEKAVYDMIHLRMPWWTDALVRELDARNVERMRCLPPEWQRHVIMTYSSGDKEVRDVQKHVSGTIGGVRRLIFADMTSTEAARLQDLANAGTRVSYLPCNGFSSKGRCQYGDKCRHPHIS